MIDNPSNMMRIALVFGPTVIVLVACFVGFICIRVKEKRSAKALVKFYYKQFK